MLRAHNAGDLDGVMSFFEPAACFVTRSGRIASGLDAVREVYRANLANRQQLVLGKLTVIHGGGDVALVIFPWTSTAVLATGEKKTWQGTATDIVSSPSGWSVAPCDRQRNRRGSRFTLGFLSSMQVG